MSSKEQVVSIRIPAALLKRVDAAARKNQRTRSGEVRLRLEESLKRPAPEPAPGAA